MKLMHWIIKTAAGAVITSLICMAATLYTLNAYVNILLKQYQIPQAVTQAVDWPKFISYIGEQLNSGASQGAIAAKPGEKAAQASAQPSKEQNDSSDRASGGPASEPEPPKDAVAVWSQQSGDWETSTDADRMIVMTGEEFSRKKDELTEEQKMEIFSVISRMPQEEIQQISLWLEGGLTASELALAEELLRARLEPEEYEGLLELMKPE